MGTFIIRPTVLASGGTPIIDINDSLSNYLGWVITDPNTIVDALADISESPSTFLAGGISTGTQLNFSDTLRLIFAAQCIYLDGSPTPIAFATLPSGFTPLSASVLIIIDFTFVPVGGFANFWLQQEAGNDGIILEQEYSYDFSTPPSMLSIVNNGCGLRVDMQIPAVVDEQALIQFIYNLRVEGVYTNTIYQYSINPPSGSEVEVGQQIIITSPGTDPLTDLNLNEVTLLLNDVPTEIDYQDEQTLIFTVPNIVGSMEIEVVGNGVQFSGSVTLGVLIILLIAASGIYTLVLNKANDTLYQSIRDGTTRDVKIPNPFAKTGFIGG